MSNLKGRGPKLNGAEGSAMLGSNTSAAPGYRTAPVPCPLGRNWTAPRWYGEAYVYSVGCVLEKCPRFPCKGEPGRLCPSCGSSARGICRVCGFKVRTRKAKTPGEAGMIQKRSV